MDGYADERNNDCECQSHSLPFKNFRCRQELEMASVRKAMIGYDFVVTRSKHGAFTCRR